MLPLTPDQLYRFDLAMEINILSESCHKKLSDRALQKVTSIIGHIHPRASALIYIERAEEIGRILNSKKINEQCLMLRFKI